MHSVSVIKTTVPLIEDALALPIPAHIGDQFSLRYHLALAVTREGKGSAAAAQALLEMVLAAGMLADRGHEKLEIDRTRMAEAELGRLTAHGLRFGQWGLSEAGFDVLRALLATHDAQLCTASARDVMQVLARVYEWANAAPGNAARHKPTSPGVRSRHS